MSEQKSAAHTNDSKKVCQMMSHLSYITWEQCAYDRLAPSEMKLRCHIWE